MDADTLAFLISDYIDRNPQEEPTPAQLANYVVSRQFEMDRLNDPDAALLDFAANVIIEARSDTWNEFTISRDARGTVFVRHNNGPCFYGRNVSEALKRYAEYLARLS